MILILGKEGILHTLGNDIKNVFQNFFTMRGRWQREGDELLIHYSKDAPHATNQRKMIVCMLDGRRDHGGLADRLRGIVSTYYVCKKLGYDFRINFVHPFPLIDYLVPNTYDWRVSQDELCYNADDAEPMFCGSQATHVEPKFQELWIRKRCLHANKQLHVYTNALIFPKSKKYGELFQELFRPSDRLEEALGRYAEHLKGGYVTMSLRFIGLLGDFVEKDGRQISPEEQQRLMDRCVAKIRSLYDSLPVKKKVLLTSDSVRFLKYAGKRLDFIYYIPGDVVHIDFYEGKSEDINMKLFVDMMLISRAEKAYLLQTGKMYNSGFPRRAAQAGGVPFKHIRF